MRENLPPQGKCIRALRVMHGWSAQVLADRIGRSSWWLYQVEAGLIRPEPEQLDRIWSALSSGERTR